MDKSYIRLGESFQTLYEIYQENVVLFEGLQYSHRADITLNHVIKKFGNYLYGNYCKTSLNDLHNFGEREYIDLVSRIPLKDNIEFNEYLDFFGYHLGSENKLNPKKITEINLKTNGDVYSVSFEAKYPTEIDRNKLSNDLYHLTPDFNLNNILKSGLLPKDSKTTFHHPGNRIYLLSTQNPEKDLRNLSLKLTENTKNKIYVKLRIVDYYPKHEKFFCDPNLGWGDLSVNSRGVFVHRGIHPSFIKIF